MLKAGIRHNPRVSRVTGRRAPLEYADAVELWAREHGTHATLKWYDAPMNCWGILLAYKPNDPRAQDGSKGEPVFLHEWKDPKWWAQNDPRGARRHPQSNRIMPAYKALELEDLGVSGVIGWLDKGNLLSGRGEFSSAADAGRRQVEKFRDAKHKRRLFSRDEAKHRALDDRRKFLKIPMISVGIEFNPDKKAS